METVIDDAYTSGLQALAFNKIGRAVQRMVTPRQKLPKGYLRDRANSVAELDASKQCKTGKGAYVAPKGGGGITIEYTSYGVSEEVVNIGTYYPTQ